MKKNKASMKPAKQAECPAWMMTFGDCMSLLVCFFVMLIAFSNMEEEQLAAMLGAMRGALGGVQQIGEPIQQRQIEADGLTRVEGDAEELRLLSEEEISHLLPQMIAELRLSLQDEPTAWPDRLLIRMMEEGLSIVIQTRDLFVNGTSEWQNESDALWKGIGGLLQGRTNAIRIMAVLNQNTTIEGDQIRSVWGLGLLRAEKVANALHVATRSPESRFGVGVQVSATAQADALEITILGDAPPAREEQLKQNWLLEAWR
jgi:chemotaxis protein MotB